MNSRWQNETAALKVVRRVHFLSLLTSGSTLLCCALPAALVAIGALATLTTLITVFPQLIWISEHKLLVFGLAAAMLLIAGLMQWQARFLPCPTDPVLAKKCAKVRRQGLLIYLGSLAIYLFGVFFAFVAPYLL